MGASTGGTIIDENTIVTAAHCVASGNCYSAPSKARFLEILEETDADHIAKIMDLKPCKYTSVDTFEILAGISTIVESKKDWKDKQSRGVDKIFVYEKYITYLKSKTPALHNDIAVIKLSEPLQWNDAVRPACLPEANFEMPEKQQLVVTGFGLTYEGSGVPSEKLMEAKVRLFTDDECDEFYDDVISQGMFCAGDSKGQVDACSGDSGGPIGIDDLSVTKFTLTGIVSWGTGCGRAGKPGVYTEVSKFLDFIESARKGDISPVSEA